MQKFDKSAVEAVTNFPHEYQNKMIKLTIMAYQPTNQDMSKKIDSFSAELKISKQQLYEILGTYIDILRCLLENTDVEFKKRLLDVGFSSYFLEKFYFVNNRDEIINSLSLNFNYCMGQISSLKWKIDISLRFMKKQMTPVILCLELKNGQRYSIEIDMKLFHKLRFNVALILKELNISK